MGEAASALIYFPVRFYFNPGCLLTSTAAPLTKAAVLRLRSAPTPEALRSPSPLQFKRFVGWFLARRLIRESGFSSRDKPDHTDASLGKDLQQQRPLHQIRQTACNPVCRLQDSRQRPRWGRGGPGSCSALPGVAFITLTVKQHLIQ